jgi:hypothetical protein
LLTESENVMPTHHEKIKIFKGPRINGDAVEAWLLQLEVLLETRNHLALVTHLKELVPEYQPSRIAAIRHADPQPRAVPRGRLSTRLPLPS